MTKCKKSAVQSAVQSVIEGKDFKKTMKNKKTNSDLEASLLKSRDKLRKEKTKAENAERECIVLRGLVARLEARLVALENAAPANGPAKPISKGSGGQNARKRQKPGSSESDSAEMDVTREEGTEEPKAKEKPKEKTYADQAKKIPPVVAATKEWLKTRETLKANGIGFSHAKKQGQNIKIFPKTSGDHRSLTTLLKEAETEYYTYNLPEEKRVSAVLKGLHEDTPINDIKKELEMHGYAKAEVSRMTSRRTKKPLPLFLVKCDSSEIYKVNRFFDCVVDFEPKRKTSEIVQCYRCQKYGHTQKGCNFTARCVKCAEKHQSRDCPLAKPKANKDGKIDHRNAKCVNCNEMGHPASYRGCKKCPKKDTKGPRQTNKVTASPQTAPMQRAQAAKTTAPAQKEHGNQDHKDLLKAIMEALAPAIQAMIEAKTTK